MRTSKPQHKRTKGLATTHRKQIMEALQVLEETAQQYGPELQQLLAGRYTHLNSLLAGTKDGWANVLSGPRQRAGGSAPQVKDAARQVSGAPCTDLERTAIVGFMQGYIFGREGK